MLHFWPAEPIGQVESMPKVHFTEHTGWPIMSMLPVQTPLSPAVEVSLTVAQVAPNVRGAGPPASGPGAGVSPEQATRRNDQARRRRCMGKAENAAHPPPTGPSRRRSPGASHEEKRPGEEEALHGETVQRSPAAR